MRVRVRVKVRVRLRIRFRVRGGAYFQTHMHACMQDRVVRHAV